VNPLALQIWNAGQTYVEYRRVVQKNADGFDSVYQQGVVEPSDLDWLRQLPPLRVLAIAADWCPDVWQTLPLWSRVVEALPGWDMRIFDRDRHPTLMQQFTWFTGAERVPVYAFYHHERLQAWWSARSAAAEGELQAQLGGRKYGDLTPNARAELGVWFENAYENRLRQANFSEILALLAAFYHLEPPVRSAPPNQTDR